MPGNLRGIPASVIATWPKPNYVDPEQRTWIVPYACVLQTIMTLMVGTRLWLRMRQKAGTLGLDDAMLVPAFLAATTFTTLVILSNERYGTDRHVYDVPPQWFEYTALMAWTSEFAFLIATCCTKISVLLFYRRLVQGTFSKRWKYATIGAIFFTAAYMIAFALVLVFNCNPTEAYWKAYSFTYTKKYTCSNTTYLNPVSGAISVVSDLYAVLLPMGMLRHFDAPRRQKVALNAVFSLGLFVVASGSLRTYYLYRLGVAWDITWIGYDVFIWSTLEIQIALICASAPALRVFFRQYLSDPISRVMHTARSVTSTRNTNRDSKVTDNGVVTYNSHARNSSMGSSEMGDKNLIQPSVKPSLETVGESEIESSSPSTAPSEPYVIRTPADFEAYALQNLERNRPPPRPTFLRPPSEYSVSGDMHSSLNGPFTDWHTPPKSRGA